MAEAKVEFATVKTVSDRLNSEAPEISLALSTLLSKVNDLLTSSGGLWLQKSSPVMATQYSEFTASMKTAIDNIPKFAATFNSIVHNLHELDEKLAVVPDKKD
jgi:hypothetical protein